MWVVEDGRRSKEAANNYAVVSLENAAKMKEWAERHKEIGRLQDINRALLTSMEKIKVKA